jgi:hypothetical protein
VDKRMSDVARLGLCGQIWLLIGRDSLTVCRYSTPSSPFPCYSGCGNMGLRVMFLGTKVEASIADFILKSHTFPRYISMKAIDNCLKLKLS